MMPEDGIVFIYLERSLLSKKISNNCLKIQQLIIFVLDKLYIDTISAWDKPYCFS